MSGTSKEQQLNCLRHWELALRLVCAQVYKALCIMLSGESEDGQDFKSLGGGDLSIFVFVGHGFLHHAEDVCKVNHTQWHPTGEVLQGANFVDPAAFRCSTSLGRKAKLHGNHSDESVVVNVSDASAVLKSGDVDGGVSLGKESKEPGQGLTIVLMKVTLISTARF